MSGFKAIIFDMDGVLVDDFEPWLKFDKSFLQQFGLVPDAEYQVFVNGRSQEEVASWLKKKYKIKESLEEIWQSKMNYIKKVYEIEAKPMVGIENLLEKIKGNGLRIALCSAAKMWMIETVLDRFGWHKYFEAVVSSDHVSYRGKPNPEIYLYTAKLLGIDPVDCVVVEDAENGVAAANSAGMKCIGFKDSRFQLFDDLSKADLIVNSLEDEKILKFLNI